MSRSEVSGGTGWSGSPTGGQAGEERLVAALALALLDAHPSYASTAGWHGGVGGQAITRGCSLIDPPPADEWIEGVLEDVLRSWLRDNPTFDLDAAKKRLQEERA